MNMTPDYSTKSKDSICINKLVRTDYQDFETINLNMRQASKNKKKNKNASGICINLFKVKTLIMIEEIAPSKKNKGRKYLN